MTHFKKFAWSGTAVALAMFMALAMFVQVAYAATLTQAANATVAPASNPATGSGAYTMLGNIVITEAAVSDLDDTETITLTTPADWSWNNGAQVVTASGTNGLSATVANTSATVTTVTISGESTGSAGVLTISGLQIRPDTAASAATGGNIVAAGSAGFAGNVGLMTGQTGGNISATVSNSVSVDGSNSATVSAWVFNNGDLQTGKSVTFNASMGGFGTTGSTSTTAFTNATTGIATATYRGIGGTAGTDTITITTPAPNAGVGSVSATLTAAQAGSPSALAFVNAWNVGATGNASTNVAPSSSTASPAYTSPQTGTNVVFRVTDTNGAGAGLAAQVLQVTTDKGGLVAYNGTCTTTSPKAINVTTQTDNTSFGGSSTSGPGRAGVRFCAGTGAANMGAATLTATNITTTMATASATVTTAGVPANIETTWTDGALEVTVTDADGNPAADGTSIALTIADTIGAASPASALTRAGKVTFAVALTGTAGNAIVTVRDDGPAGEVRLTKAVNVTATGPTTPTTPTGDGSLTAPSFGTGNVGSAVFAGGTIEQLSAQVTAAGGTSVWAQTSSGSWVRYNTLATGATAFVNNAFMEAFTAGFSGPTAVFVVK